MKLLTKKPAPPDVSALSARVDELLEGLAETCSLHGVLDAAQFGWVQAAHDQALAAGLVDHGGTPSESRVVAPWPEDALDKDQAAVSRAVQSAKVDLAATMTALREAVAELAGTLERSRLEANARALTAEMATYRTDAADLRPCCGRRAVESCTVEALVIEGETWRRLPFGGEPRGGGGRRRQVPQPASCPGCGAPRDGTHHFGCTVEECPTSDPPHPLWSCTHERRVP